MNFISTINPFYANRGQRLIERPEARQNKPVWAKLPRIPVNASPVPTLTSLYHSAEAGDYGNRGYPGNCGGNLIKDLLRFFKPRKVFDPLCGAPHNGSSVAQPIMWRPADRCRGNAGGGTVLYAT